MVDHWNPRIVLLKQAKHSWRDGWNVDQLFEGFPLVCSFAVGLTCFIGNEDDDVDTIVGFSSAFVNRGGMGGGRGTVVEFFFDSLSINQIQSDPKPPLIWIVFLPSVVTSLFEAWMRLSKR